MHPPHRFPKTFRALVAGAGCLLLAGHGLAATITGTVTVGGSGVGGISVDVYSWDGAGSFGILVAFDITAADGTYTATDLPAGNYRVGFRDNDGNYAPVFYSNAGDIQSATDVPLTSSQTVAGINAALVAASSIGGTVTAADGGTPLEMISITVFRLVGSDWEFTGGQVTAADGSYLISGLAAGSYRLQFNDSSGLYAEEFYDNKATLALADTVNVPASSAVNNISASLAAASSISGTVTGPGGAPLPVPIYITALTRSDPQGPWLIASSGSTDAAGNYTLNGLASGTYRVEFLDYSGIYATEYYNDVWDIDSATNVVVGVAATTSGINAALSLAGYDAWARDNNIDPASDGAPGADPDKDGFINNSEYAFGTDPNFSTPALISPRYVSNNLVVTYMEKINGLVSYAKQTNSDLGGAAWGNISTVPVDDPDQAEVPTGYSRKNLPVPGSGKQFFRLKASWN